MHCESGDIFSMLLYIHTYDPCICSVSGLRASQHLELVLALLPLVIGWHDTQVTELKSD